MPQENHNSKSHMHPSVHQASLVAQIVKCLPAMWETWVQPLGREDPLEKEMATHSSSLALKIPWTEDPGRLLVVFIAALFTIDRTWKQPKCPLQCQKE